MIAPHFTFITSVSSSPERPRRSERTVMMMAYHFLLEGWRNTAQSGVSAHKYSACVPYVCCIYCVSLSRCNCLSIRTLLKFFALFGVLQLLRLVCLANRILAAVRALLRLNSTAENKMALVECKNHPYHRRIIIAHPPRFTTSIFLPRLPHMGLQCASHSPEYSWFRRAPR